MRGKLFEFRQHGTDYSRNKCTTEKLLKAVDRRDGSVNVVVDIINSLPFKRSSFLSAIILKHHHLNKQQKRTDHEYYIMSQGMRIDLEIYVNSA